MLQYFSNADSNKGIVNGKRMHEALSTDLDAVLFECFQQRRSENNSITRSILCEKVREQLKELKVEVPCEYLCCVIVR